MSQLAERYATALFDVTEEKGLTDKTLEVLSALNISLKQNKDVQEVLTTPLISDSNKLAVLKSALGDEAGKELETFFNLLIKNDRLAIIDEIVEAFQEKVNADKGIVNGVVRSAVELSEQEKANIQKMIEGKLDKKVDLDFKVEADMIGGVEAKVGSYIFEDSIKSHMQKLNDFITRRVQ